MITWFKRHLLSALGLAVLAGSAALSAAPAEARGRPALWQLSDRDTKIYLFGTIHLLPSGEQWRTRKFDKAIASSQALVVETVIDERNPQELIGALQRLGYRDGLPPLASRIAPDKRAKLEAAIAKTQIPRPTFDRMETWAAAFVLLGAQFRDIGVSGTQGVEAVLRSAFAQAGKPVDQLETNGEQLSLFDTLPESAQRALLEGSIEAPAEMQVQFQSMLAAWSRGDVASIAQSFNRDLSGSPELKDALLKRRNANWTYWLSRRMARPGTVLVAVGAGHLAGEDSVIAMLEKGGYRVRRIQ